MNTSFPATNDESAVYVWETEIIKEESAKVQNLWESYFVGLETVIYLRNFKFKSHIFSYPSSQKLMYRLESRN